MTKGKRPRGKKSKKDSYRSNLEREFAKNLKARSIDFGYENHTHTIPTSLYQKETAR